MQTWKPSSDNEKIGTMLWSYSPTYPTPSETALEIGQRVYIVERSFEWYRVILSPEKHKETTLVPSKFVKLLKSSNESSGSSKYIKKEENFFSEFIFNAVKSWIHSLKSTSRSFDLEKACILFKELIDIRRSIHESGSKLDPYHIINLVNEGNRYYGLEFVPYNNDRFVDITNTSLHEIFKIHSEISLESISSTNGSHVGSFVDTYSSSRPRYVNDDFYVYLKIDEIACDLLDPSSFVFAIYDCTTDSYITEKFFINFKDPLASKVVSEHLSSALFELTKSYVLHTLCLFIKIYRLASLSTDKKNESQFLYKRPYAYAYYFITDLLKGLPMVEQRDRMQLHFCEEAEFGAAEKIPSRDSSGIRNIPNPAFYVSISIKYFNLPLESIKNEYPEMFNPDLYVTSLFGMPDVFSPDRFQNDFYLTLRGVYLDKFVLKGKPMNIEAAVTVWTSQGQLLPNCIKIGCGKDITLQTEYKTAVMYHVNSPAWNETISIVFPGNRMDNIRILVTFTHISSSQGKSKVDKMTMLALTVIKLETANHTILGNTDAAYFLKKLDSVGGSGKHSSASIMDDVRKLSSYFKERYATNESVADESNKFSPGDVLNIRTKLFSTIHTYIVDVYVIKEFEIEKNKADLKETFSRFPYVDTLEVVKFIKPLFKNIAQNMQPIDDNGDNLYYFQSLTKILGAANEKRFFRFIPVLEEAINNTSMPEAWKRIIEYVEISIKRIAEKDKHIYYDVVKLFIDNLSYIFRVLVTSYSQYMAIYPTNSEIMNPTLMDVFKSMFKLLSLDLHHLYPLQIKILNNFIVVVEDTHNIFSINELGELISNLIPSIPDSTIITTTGGVKTNNTVMYKIKFISKIVMTEKFKDSKFRGVFCPIIISNLISFIKGDSHLDICSETADVLMAILKYPDIVKHAPEINYLLKDLISIFLDANQNIVGKSKSRTAGNTLNVLLSLLSIMTEELFNEQFTGMSDDQKTVFLSKMFFIFFNIYNSKYFPSSHACVWISLSSELLKITFYLKNVLKEKFSSVQSKEEIELVQSFFDFALEFINAPCLQIENSPSLNVRDVLYRKNDMRVQMAETMFDMWGEMEHDMIQNLYRYSQTLVTTSLMEVPELRLIMLHILYDFLIYDYKANKNMDTVARNIISYIDSDTYNDSRYKDFSHDFKKIMDRLWNMTPDVEIKKTGTLVSKQVLDTINTLAFYSLPKKFEDCLILHSYRSYNMIEFHSNISHEDMMQSNTVRLLNYNELLEAHTEAAICYYNLSKNYEWDFKTVLPANEKFEQSSPGTRKELLLLRACELFEKGLNLEKAVTMCQYLIPLYEEYDIDYMKLSDLYNRISSLLKRISCGESSIDNYYRLTFIGMDFPESVRNKSFICHMGSCASLGATMKFISNNFPYATVPSTSTFDPELREKNVQYIFVQAFKPIPQDKKLYEKYYEYSEPISRYYSNYNINSFFSQSTIESKRDKTSNVPPTVTFIKTVCRTQFSLPTISMLSPVIEETKVVMSDLEQTLDNINGHTNELRDLCRNLSFNKGLIKNIQMKASGNLNAFVNGGLSLVIPKFFSDVYFNEHPDEVNKLELLKGSLQNFMDANALALDILNEYLADTMGGFVANLINSYQLAREELKEKTHIEPPDLSVLQNLYLVPGGSSSNVHSNTTKSTATNASNSNLETQQQSASVRRDTVTSNEGKSQLQNYGTIKKSKNSRSIKVNTEEEQRGRSSSMRSTDKAVQTLEVKEPPASPMIAEKFKKKYGLFHKKK